MYSLPVYFTDSKLSHPCVNYNTLSPCGPEDHLGGHYLLKVRSTPP